MQPKQERANYLQIRIYGIANHTEAIELENLQLTFRETPKYPFVFGENLILSQGLYGTEQELDISSNFTI